MSVDWVQLHPWNHGFTWSDHTGPATNLDPEQVALFDREGFVPLRGALDPGEVATAREDVDALVAAADEELAGAGGRQGISERGAITFAAHLVARSARLRRLVRSPVLLGVCCDLLGPDVDLYWDQAVYKNTEKPRRFPWHQDNGYVFVEPQAYLTCWIPLVPATPDNGCPQVVPRAHRLGTLAHHYVEPIGWECFAAPPAEPVTVPVSPGDVLAFSSLTPHLTGPNTTSEARRAYIVQYCVAGSQILLGDPAAGAPEQRVPCEEGPARFPVLRGGRPVAAQQ